MKIVCAIVFVITVLANSKVLGDTFECYECEGSECSDNSPVIACSADTVATPKPTTTPATTSTSTIVTTPTASSVDTTPTTVVTNPTTTVSSSAETTATTIAESTTSTTLATVPETTTITTTLATTPTAATTTPMNPVVNNFGTISRKRRAADSSYACYTLYYDSDNKSVVKKGCVENVLNACDIAADGAKGPLESCTICKDSKCNSSAAIKFSMASTLLMFLILLL